MSWTAIRKYVEENSEDREHKQRTLIMMTAYEWTEEHPGLPLPLPKKLRKMCKNRFGVCVDPEYVVEAYVLYSDPEFLDELKEEIAQREENRKREEAKAHGETE
jgi:hypothetical protein